MKIRRRRVSVLLQAAARKCLVMATIAAAFTHPPYRHPFQIPHAAQSFALSFSKKQTTEAVKKFCASLRHFFVGWDIFPRGTTTGNFRATLFE
jgi:hypothetical protein